MGLDVFAGGGNAGGVPDGKVVEVADGAFWCDFDFAVIEGMELEGVFAGLVGLFEELFDVLLCHRNLTCP